MSLPSWLFMQLNAAILDAIFVEPRLFRFFLSVPSQARYYIDLFLFLLNLGITLWDAEL